jgi:high-affinity K+ transport system ATPase subunit B
VSTSGDCSPINLKYVCITPNLLFMVLAASVYTAGDYSPTYWATQLMLIALLIITFTLLPYLTGELMLQIMLPNNNNNQSL